MKPLVVASVNDDTGTRCIDVTERAGVFAWAECRRDPEDPHGWRFTGAGGQGFASAEAAEQAARDTLGWGA